MANSNEGQDHKDKYFDTSRKILSQEMIFCENFFFNWSNVKVKRLSTYKRSHHKGYSCKISDSSTNYSKVISKIKFLSAWFWGFPEQNKDFANKTWGSGGYHLWALLTVFLVL